MNNIVAIDWGVKNVGITIYLNGEYTAKCLSPDETFIWLKSNVSIFDTIIIENFNPNSHQAHISNKYGVLMNQTIGQLQSIVKNANKELVMRNSSDILMKNKDNGKYNINFMESLKELANVNFKNIHIRDSTMHLLQYQALQKPKINKKDYIVRRKNEKN